MCIQLVLGSHQFAQEQETAQATHGLHWCSIEHIGEKLRTAKIPECSRTSGISQSSSSFWYAGENMVPESKVSWIVCQYMISSNWFDLWLGRNGNGKHILDLNYSLVPLFNAGFNGNNIYLQPLLLCIDHRWIRTARSARSVQRCSAKQRQPWEAIQTNTCFLPPLVLHIGKSRITFAKL